MYLRSLSLYHGAMASRTSLTRTALLAVLLSIAQLGYAGGPRTLKWQDLIPPMPADHPLARLTRYQYFQLLDIGKVRERKARGDKSLSPTELAEERKASRSLAQAGIDVDGLLAKGKAYEEQRRGAASGLNAALDGQWVRLPGYVLPLEFGPKKKISEFLLVPWVGACIHTPPPPPNQIVHVKTDKAVEIDGMFAPVWVTGSIATPSSTRSLFLVDGSADIHVGYSMRASAVERYTE
jgi:hypothetical protein